MATATIPPYILESLAHLPACFGYPVAQRETGLSIPTLRRYADSGRLAVMRTAPGSGGGGRVLIARVELARFLASLADPVARSA